MDTSAIEDRYDVCEEAERMRKNIEELAKAGFISKASRRKARERLHHWYLTNRYKQIGTDS